MKHGARLLWLFRAKDFTPAVPIPPAASLLIGPHRLLPGATHRNR